MKQGDQQIINKQNNFKAVSAITKKGKYNNCWAEWYRLF